MYWGEQGGEEELVERFGVVERVLLVVLIDLPVFPVMDLDRVAPVVAAAAALACMLSAQGHKAPVG